MQFKWEDISLWEKEYNTVRIPLRFWGLVCMIGTSLYNEKSQNNSIEALGSFLEHHLPTASKASMIDPNTSDAKDVVDIANKKRSDTFQNCFGV